MRRRPHLLSIAAVSQRDSEDLASPLIYLFANASMTKVHPMTDDTVKFCAVVTTRHTDLLG